MEICEHVQNVTFLSSTPKGIPKYSVNIGDTDYGDQIKVDPVSIMDVNEPRWTTRRRQLPPSVEGRFDNNVPKRPNQTA